MKLTANRAIRGYRVARGGTFDAKEKDARTLLALGYATKEVKPKALVPIERVVEPVVEPVEEVRPRRRYRRRDMVASD
jgi:hypothetical protein